MKKTYSVLIFISLVNAYTCCHADTICKFKNKNKISITAFGEKQSLECNVVGSINVEMEMGDELKHEIGENKLCYPKTKIQEIQKTEFTQESSVYINDLLNLFSCLEEGGKKLVITKETLASSLSYCAAEPEPIIDPESTKGFRAGIMKVLKWFGIKYAEDWLEDREVVMFTIDDQVVMKFHTEEGKKLRKEAIDLVNSCLASGNGCDLLEKKFAEIGDFLYCRNKG